MSIEDALSAADRLRGEARVFTRFGDLSRAHQLLTGLVTSLAKFLNGDDDRSTSEHGDFERPTSRHAIAVRLADTYGMIGGIECRQGNFDKALEAYRSGRRLEQDRQYGLSDSYNLTNTFVVALIIDSSHLEEMQDDIRKAVEAVGRQVDGERRNQWWAWADYGLLCLLEGETSEASRAYHRFAACGPAASDFASVRRVLDSLANAVSLTDEAKADEIRNEMRELESIAEATQD
ncbi:hypothetical protein AB0B31_27720 [Catellatospora citrea]|uniref:hypothetical protein n=1 Tax=Catellatospora citrea TaxID=53366 RepID=UPI0033C78F2C